MLRKLAQTLACLALGVLAWQGRPWREVSQPPGVLAPRTPQQSPIAPRVVAALAGCTLTAVADYALTARVLHTRRYHDDGSRLAPRDVAVGWGPMSDSAVLDELTISQGSRFFFYRWSERPPVAPAVIEAHAANMHLIPANAEVGQRIDGLRRGELVALAGQLVNVAGRDGFTWRTSLRRDDTGRGACEVYYVTAVTVGKAGKEFAPTLAVR